MTTAIVRQLDLPGQVTPTGWKLPRNLDEVDWVKYGQYLAKVEGAMQWWIGDWWRHGVEREYGDGAKLAERIGLGYRTVRTYAWVCGCYELSERNENVSFGHHRLVANRPPRERADWLRKAAREGLSVGQLQYALNPLEPDCRSELYRHYGMNGILLYVGVSWDSFNRYYEHMRRSEWAHLTVKITIQHFIGDNHRSEAEEAERLAIANERPLYNIHHRDAA